MRDLSDCDITNKIGEDLINYYLSKYNDFYIYFTSTFCNNCKEVSNSLENINNDKFYLKLLIDSNDTDEYMDYLEENLGVIKVPALIYINNMGDIERKVIGEEKCKEELYSINIDNSDDF